MKKHIETRNLQKCLEKCLFLINLNFCFKQQEESYLLVVKFKVFNSAVYCMI